MQIKTEKIDKRKNLPQLFKKGQSGNPGGKPKGCLSPKREAEKLLLSRKDDIIKEAIEQALRGNWKMIVAMLPFIMPKVPDDTTIELEEIVGKSVKEKVDLIQKAMAEGRISPLEAAACLNVVEKGVNLVELQDLEERLKVVEAKI